ncbi:hypothetical protein ACFRI7_32230 [Streptomyces sp. NPDC056716]|uniref:hypothetical protein n=1 Tax=unclassified Streptomyces TaxID=2593676 RepID=UPI0036C8C229
MARIRTIKPEAFESEDLASVSVTAMLTFVGLLTQADDEGRHRDHPAIIAGRLWALRPEHTPAHVARDLDELANAGLLCRYTGCDGRTYLHIVTWERHQKINRPSESRLPRCAGHHARRNCGRCTRGPCPTASTTGVGPAPAQAPHAGAAAPAADSDRPAGPEDSPGGRIPPPPPQSGDGLPQDGEVTGQGRSHGDLSEGSPPGSRIVDPGSFLTGREAPAPGRAPGGVSAKELVAEYASGCPRRPPGDVLGLLGRKARALLDEGFEPVHIRAAMERLRARGLHPSVLPSLVNEIVNTPAAPAPAGAGVSGASGGGPWAGAGASYQPYFNTAQPAPTTFGGSL